MLNHRTRLYCGGRLCLLPLLLLLVTSRPAWSQAETPRDHFQLKIGGFYDQGDFGTLDTTKVFFTPITLRYLGNRFDVSITPSYAQVSTIGGVRLIDGIPTRPEGGTALARVTRSGLGDTLRRGRIQLLEEGASVPAVTPFVKVKIPTARESLGLGTGKTDYGYGVEIDKQLLPVLLFGDLSYTVMGDITGLDLQNRVGASFGVGGRVSESVVVSGLLEWRRSIFTGNPNPTELVGVINYRLSPTLTLSPNIYAGLNDSSPDFGAGLELSFRFGRY